MGCSQRPVGPRTLLLALSVLCAFSLATADSGPSENGFYGCKGPECDMVVFTDGPCPPGYTPDNKAYGGYAEAKLQGLNKRKDMTPPRHAYEQPPQHGIYHQQPQPYDMRYEQPPPMHNKHVCVKCPEATYAAAYGDHCEPCGKNETSPPGSPNADHCTCIPGYGRNETGGECVICPNDSFSDPHRQECIKCSESCGNSTTTGEGSTSHKDCWCKPGFGGPHCEICEPGFYSPGGDEYDPRPECKQCPDTFNGSPRPGATKLAECGGCKPGFSNPTTGCQACPEDTFSPGGNAAECTRCGPNQQSPPKSPSRAWCSCIKGFGKDANDACAICPLGNFWGGPEDTQKPDPNITHHDAYDSYSSYDSYSDKEDPSIEKLPSPPGIQPCHSCALVFPSNGGTTLFKGSTSAKDCVCAPGFGGQRCEICAAGLYSPGGEVHDPQPDCIICPQNTLGSAAPGATDKFQCGGCVPGYGGRHCEKCHANSFSPGGNYDACQACGANQISPPGSPSRDYCECVPGFGQTGAPNTCSLCPKGSFSAIPPSNRGHHSDDSSDDDAHMMDAHDQLSARVQQVLPCTLCSTINPAGSFDTIAAGSTSAKDCVCQPGFGSAFCNQCPSGTWSAGGTTEPCKACPGGPSATSPPGATSPADCGCAAGSAGPNCEQCPPNTFSPGAKQPCQPCPEGTSSPAGSTNQNQCVVCAAGTVASESGCKSCPAGTTTPAGAAGRECSACAPGFGIEQGANTCTPCPPATFSTGGSFSSCSLCPIGMDSTVGAKAEAECFCNTPGWGIIQGVSSSCQPCPVGTFSAQVRGRNECQACSPCMTTLQPASGSSTDCVCDVGCGQRDIFAPSTPICQACISPTYQGRLDDSGVPVTTATRSEPYPACVTCNSVDALQVTGSPHKVCTAPGSQVQSAYCSVKNIPAIGERFSLRDPVKVSACGTQLLTKVFGFQGSTIQKFVLPKGIVSMSAEIAGAAGAAGFRCAAADGACSATTKGGLGGRLTVKNLETVFAGGEEIHILVGGAASEPSSPPKQSIAGSGGGYSAILSGPDPGSPYTVWYASAGGGGGGAGSVCLPNGVCLGASGRDGCASDLLRVTYANSVGQPAPKAGPGGAGFAVEGGANRTAPAAANGQQGSLIGGGSGGGGNVLAAPPKRSLAEVGQPAADPATAKKPEGAKAPVATTDKPAAPSDKKETKKDAVLSDNNKLSAAPAPAVGKNSDSKQSANVTQPANGPSSPSAPVPQKPVPPTVLAVGGGGGGFGKLGAEGLGGFGGGGAGSMYAVVSTMTPATSTPGGGGGGGFWGGAGGDNSVESLAHDAALTRVARGGGGGNCMVATGLHNSKQQVHAEALAGANAGNGYVKLTIVYAAE